MPETSNSTLGRVAEVLGVASKYGGISKTPIDSILRMQQFQLWGFLFMICAIAGIIWLIQCKLDGIEKQYKEQFILLHRLFKSHQDLQIKVHKATKVGVSAPVVALQSTVDAPAVPENTEVAEVAENQITDEKDSLEDTTGANDHEARIEVDDALPSFFQ